MSWCSERGMAESHIRACRRWSSSGRFVSPKDGDTHEPSIRLQTRHGFRETTEHTPTKNLAKSRLQKTRLSRMVI